MGVLTSQTDNKITFVTSGGDPDVALASIQWDTVDAELVVTGAMVSAKPIVTIADATNTLSLTAATHANRTLKVLDATLAITLPEATGTGNVYTVVQGIAATNSSFVTADTTNAGLNGFVVGSDTDAAGTYTWVTAAATDTVTYDGTATGGKLGDWIRFTDIATDLWLVEGMIKQSGGSEATPFSAAV